MTREFIDHPELLLDIVLALLIVALGLSAVAGLQAQLNVLIRAILNLVAAPLRFLSHALDKAVQGLSALLAEASEQLAERHDDKLGWAIIGSLLQFTAMLLATLAAFAIDVLRIAPLLGHEAVESDVDFGLTSTFFGFLFVALILVLGAPILDELWVTFLTPFRRVRPEWLRHWRRTVFFLLGLLILDYVLFAVQTQLAIVGNAVGPAASDTADEVWDPNDPISFDVPVAEPAPSAVQPSLIPVAAAALGVVVIGLTFGLLVVSLVMGGWSLAHGPVAIFILVLVFTSLALLLVAGGVRLSISALEASRLLATAVVAIPARIGRVLWNTLARWRIVQWILQRSEEQLLLHEPDPLPSLLDDPDMPVYPRQSKDHTRPEEPPQWKLPSREPARNGHERQLVPDTVWSNLVS